jgi:F-type H+-transporting ATPase subunit delta
MPHISVLARRYAEGLLQVVRESGKFLEVAGELESVARLIESDSRVRDIMQNPAYDSGARQSLLEGLRSKMGFSDSTYGFLRLVIEKKRAGLIGEMAAAYGELYREELGIQKAEVSVAQEIGPDMRDKITQAVQKITGKKPELEIRIDPSLIGGVKVRMGNTILDASVKTKLEELRESLLASA